MVTRHYDFIVVGMGVAGALIAYRLRAAGKTVLVFNDEHKQSASLVAAGIINPVTGKKFVKSWKIDILLNEALKCYSWIENQEGIKLLYRMNIVRVLPDAGAENSWLARKQDPEYALYVSEDASLGTASKKIKHPYLLSEISQSYRVDLSSLIRCTKEIFQKEEAYRSEVFVYEGLRSNEGKWMYNDVSTNGVIFCEGYKGMFNPFFGDPGYAPSGGEAVLVRIPGLGLEKMYKDELFIVPIQDDTYWVGGGYHVNVDAEILKIDGRRRLEAHISKIIDLKFEILEYNAAWRPATKQRRPFLLKHHALQNMYLINGLGTKGTSLAPWLSLLLYTHLTEGSPMPESFV